MKSGCTCGGRLPTARHAAAIWVDPRRTAERVAVVERRPRDGCPSPSGRRMRRHRSRRSHERGPLGVPATSAACRAVAGTRSPPAAEDAPAQRLQRPILVLDPFGGEITPAPTVNASSVRSAAPSFEPDAERVGRTGGAAEDPGPPPAAPSRSCWDPWSRRAQSDVKKSNGWEGVRGEGWGGEGEERGGGG
jgi:hypothetical protein